MFTLRPCHHRLCHTKYWILASVCLVLVLVSQYRDINFISDRLPKPELLPRYIVSTNNTKPIQLAQTHHMTSSCTRVRICSHKERRAHIRDVCAQLPEQEKRAPSHPRILVDEKRRLVFCEVSKSGCTTIKAIWERANNHTLAQSLEKSDLVDIHQKSNEEKFGLTAYYKWNQTWTEQNYTSFIVVRNPLDRVVSAYYNIQHWQRGEPGPDQFVKDSVLQRFNVSKEQLSFEQFVEYITNMSSGNYRDRHWATYMASCGLCSFPYDYILRLETIEEDSGPILNIMGYEKDYMKRLPRFHGKNRQGLSDETEKFGGIVNRKEMKTDGSFMKTQEGKEDTPHKINGDTMKHLVENEMDFKELSTLSPVLWLRLLQRYQTDMDVLGYTLSGPKTSSFCKVKMHSDDACC